MPKRKRARRTFFGFLGNDDAVVSTLFAEPLVSHKQFIEESSNQEKAREEIKLFREISAIWSSLEEKAGMIVENSEITNEVRFFLPFVGNK